MNEAHWKYRVAGIEFGPIDYEMLASMAARGQLAATDEVSSNGVAWQAAGDIVGLIPDKVDDSCDFKAPHRAAADHRNQDADNASAGVSSKQPGPSSTSTRPGSLKDEIDSVIGRAETVSEDEIEVSELGDTRMAISPQRGIRTAKETTGTGTENAMQQAPMSQPVSKPQAATSPVASPSHPGEPAPAVPSKSTIESVQQPAVSPAAASEVPPSSVDNNASFETRPGSPPSTGFEQNTTSPGNGFASTPKRVHPVIPQSKSTSLRIDTDVVVKIAGGLAAVTLVAACAFFLPGLAGFGGSSSAGTDSTIKETDHIVRQVLSLSDFGGTQRPKAFIGRVAANAKTLERQIEASGSTELEAELLGFHRDVLAPVFLEDGWNESNFAKIRTQWQIIRQKVSS